MSDSMKAGTTSSIFDNDYDDFRDDETEMSDFEKLRLEDATNDESVFGDSCGKSTSKGKASLEEDVVSINSDCDHSSNPAERYMDPSLLLSHIRTIISQVEEVVASLNELQKKFASSEPDTLAATCRQLFRQLCQFETIAASFVSTNSNPYHPDPARAVDISLASWTESLELCLGELLSKVALMKMSSPLPQDYVAIGNDSELKEMDRFRVTETVTSRINSSDTTWGNLTSRLEAYKRKMAEIMPILQAGIRSYATEDRMSSSVRGERAQLSSVNIPAVRRQLYLLKDTFSELKRTIRPFVAYVPAESASVFTALSDDISNIAPSLTTYLTNQGSDWLDSLLAGGLSFTEFRSLDSSYLLGVQTSMAEWENILAFEVEIRRISKRNSTQPWENEEDIEQLRAERMDRLVTDLGWRLDMVDALKKTLKIK